MVGTSGASAVRALLVTAIALSLPAWMCGIGVEAGANMPWVRPPSTSAMPSAEPL